MPELHGVVAVLPGEPTRLKQLLLLFEKTYVVVAGPDNVAASLRKAAEQLQAELELLVRHGVVELVSPAAMHAVVDEALAKRMREQAEHHPVALADRMRTLFESMFGEQPLQRLDVPREDPEQLLDFSLRVLAQSLSKSSNIQTVPVCRNPLPAAIALPGYGQPPQRVLSFDISLLVPHSSNPWERILAFKASPAGSLSEIREYHSHVARARAGYRELNDAYPWSMYPLDEGMKDAGIKAEWVSLRGFSNPDQKDMDSFIKELGSSWGRACEVELLNEETILPGRPCAYLLHFPNP
jgi:hypothetical protein